MSKAAISQLKNVWSKVGLGELPTMDETINLPAADGRTKRARSDRTAQMNLRIRPEEKQRIGLLALRENVCINEVFSRMLELYEREHGRAELAPVKSKAEKK